MYSLDQIPQTVFMPPPTQLARPPLENTHSRPRWQQELAQAIRRPELLLRALEIDNHDLFRHKPNFEMLVPQSYVARIRKSDPRDPLLLQVLPQHGETVLSSGYAADPVGDLAAMASPGLIHKYQGRVLLLLTGACAIHCRYCFRQHFPYSANVRRTRWDDWLATIRADSSIHEVIFSGGDPLNLDDARLAELALQLAEIPHLRTLRIHSRLPVVLPSRVTEELLSWLTGTRLRLVMVVHANHPQEIDGEVAGALRRIKAAGVLLLNQSVLLRAINDSPETLAALSYALFEADTLPYYLHLLDRVQGARHFEVPEDEALGLMQALRARLPGYLLPRLVKEQAGEQGKTPI